MITKEEQTRIRDEIAEMLRTSERFAEQDIFNAHGSERDVRLLLWEARELVRHTDGIVFGVVPKWPGNYRRLAWDQIENQARRQRRAGSRKHARAEAKLRLAATTAPDNAKERLNDAADRVALRLAMRGAKTG